MFDRPRRPSSRYRFIRSIRISPRASPIRRSASAGRSTHMPYALSQCASASRNASAGPRQPAEDGSSGTSAEPKTSSGQPSPPSSSTSSPWGTWRPRRGDQQAAKIRTDGADSHPDKARRARICPPWGLTPCPRRDLEPQAGTIREWRRSLQHLARVADHGAGGLANAV